MRRAVLITRQAISPRFAIRIVLNILVFIDLWAGSAPAIWHGRGGRHNCVYSKLGRWQPPIGLRIPEPPSGHHQGIIKAAQPE
jgi:hypothetical protein